MATIGANLAKNKPPYRAPCGGQWTGEIFIPQFAHYRAADATLPFLKNITQIYYPECPPPQQLKGPGAIPNCDYTDNLAPLVTYDEGLRNTPLSWLPPPVGTYGGGGYRRIAGRAHAL